MDLVNKILDNIKEYFLLYDFIEINLTENNKEGYTKHTISVRSAIDDVYVEVLFPISAGGVLLDNNDHPIELVDIWKYLHLESMRSYNLAMTRLMKMEN